MSGTIIRTTRRTGAHGGDPKESERLRGPFLRYVGRRYATTVFRELDIPVGHGTAWLAGVTVLADRYQVVVQTTLEAAGKP